ncbi:GNAT family N-acetyltransferase [Methylogaea oryzae]|uniref:Hemolysin n=1 Tax=Methylogaea oryzae TaxID=1295382 RepID=A0A8D4VMW0_9GAMM|nr:GNAT family N-acyltransferase [Methylogaea oryzae]BBL70417.1 hypothetical protein MoryE10_10230 [Methylogaea oryzae]
MPSLAAAQDAISVARPRRFEAIVTRDPALVRAAQKLRYRVFVEEMGAVIHTPHYGLDWDEIDDHCDHLIVIDNQTGAIVGTTRLLNDRQAKRLGRYYSEGEFGLEGVLGLEGRFLEIGRTCVDRNVRGGAVLTCLWGVLADYAAAGGYDYLMGCASIPAGPSGFAVEAVYQQLAAEQLGPASLNVQPRLPVPEDMRCQRDECGIPPLLKTYLRLGAWICGEPCWDPDFKVMDLFVLLPLSRMQARYERHYLSQRANEPGGTIAALA